MTKATFRPSEMQNVSHLWEKAEVQGCRLGNFPILEDTRHGSGRILECLCGSVLMRLMGHLWWSLGLHCYRRLLLQRCRKKKIKQYTVQSPK